MSGKIGNLTALTGEQLVAQHKSLRDTRLKFKTCDEAVAYCAAVEAELLRRLSAASQFQGDVEVIAERQAEQIEMLFNGDLSGGTSIRNVLANVLHVVLRKPAASPSVAQARCPKCEAGDSEYVSTITSRGVEFSCACGFYGTFAKLSQLAQFFSSPSAQPTGEAGADNCELCKGKSGGVPGNENLIEGVIVCDYCSVPLLEFERAKAGRAPIINEVALSGSAVEEPEMVFQDKIDNCFQACVASIFGLPLASVPHFQQGVMASSDHKWTQERWDAVIKFAESHNRSAFWLDPDIETNKPLITRLLESNMNYIATGKSPLGNYGHCVIWHQGKMIHDPLRTGKGIVGEPWLYIAFEQTISPSVRVVEPAPARKEESAPVQTPEEPRQ